MAPLQAKYGTELTNQKKTNGAAAADSDVDSMGELDLRIEPQVINQAQEVYTES